MEIINYILEHPYQIIAALLAIYEVFARQIPTEGNWSIVHNLAKIMDVILKNKATQEQSVLKTTTKVVKVETQNIEI